MRTRILLLAVGTLGLFLCMSTEGAEPSGARSAPAQAEHEQLPTHLRWVLENATSRPPPEVRREVRLEDKSWLMREYRRQPTLSQRVASAWMLAYLGDDEVFRLFSEGLRLGRGNRWIDESELVGVNEQLYGMGVIAQTNELAFQFLKDAINPEWWRKECKWRVKWREPRKGAYLAEIAGNSAFAVHALGLSGRAEAGVILDRMKKEGCNYVSPKDPRDHWNLDTEAYTAKRFLEVNRKMGREAFRDGLFGSEFKRFSLEWRKSEFEWCHPKDEAPWLWRDLDHYFEVAEKMGD